MSRRININDSIQEPFYQLPKMVIWDKRFRNGLSSDAKLLYMLLKDRFQLSLNKEHPDTDGFKGTFRDRNGDVYCILDNFEIAFLLNTSVKSVIKYIQELVQIGLVEYRETEGGAHKYYLMTLDSNELELAQFLGERDYHKYVLQQKKKGKPVRKTEEQCIEEQRKMQEKTNKSRVEKTTPSMNSRGEETASLGEEIIHPGGEQLTSQGVESLHPNKKELKKNKKIQSNFHSIQSSSSEEVPAESSYIADEPITREEEEEGKRMLTYLGQQLLARNVIHTTKQVNSILQNLKNNGQIHFDEVDVENAIMHFETQCLKRGKIFSPVEFFVKGFGMVLDSRHSLWIKSRIKEPYRSEGLVEYSEVVPFYNWLEQDGDGPVVHQKRNGGYDESPGYLEWRKTLNFGA